MSGSNEPLIVADDFSGACDAAARVAVNGCSAAALLAPEAVNAAILAISTESRHCSPEDARARVRSLAAFVSGRTLYKKIDSTLRGPWIDEVDELLSITDYSQAMVCPAFPVMGRTVRNGWLYVNDRRLEQIHCPYTVRDASTEDDLARIAAEICSSILPVGSAGLARHFFQNVKLPPGPGSPAPPRPNGPWLVLVGSDHPASQSQLHFLHKVGARRAVPSAVPSAAPLLINPASYPASLAGVFATGGETAARFLRSTGARGVTELRELLPGIPAGFILDGSYNGTVMIIKAGGFGAPDAILRAIENFL